MRTRALAAPIGAALLMLLAQPAAAAKLRLPDGMGGVPDIGAIPCSVFNEMVSIGPLGTKRLLLTWAQGYYRARSGKTMDEILQGAEEAGQSWDFDRLTGHLVEFCAAAPEASTSAAVADLGDRLLGAKP